MINYEPEVIEIFLSKDDDKTKTIKINELINKKVDAAIAVSVDKTLELCVKKSEKLLRTIEECIVELRKI